MKLLDRLARPLRAEGPVKWCKRCSRRHPARQPCDLYLRERRAKSGRTVRRWAH